MMDKIRVGTRPSRLAIEQVQEIQRLLPRLTMEIIPIVTSGDRDKETPLFSREGSDFFTREIDQALFDGFIDVAVHSAKDLGDKIPQGLVITAITPSISPFECLVSRGNLALKELYPGARVGTSSQKRKQALVNFRSDLTVKDIRGNIDERLAQLDSGIFDAIIVAHAALIRLGYEYRIAEIISKEIMEPHPLQGALAIEAREDDEEVAVLFSKLDVRKNGKYR